MVFNLIQFNAYTVLLREYLNEVDEDKKKELKSKLEAVSKGLIPVKGDNI